METNLLRVKVDEKVVARTDRAGQFEWVDFEAFKHFCERYVDLPMLEARQRQANRDLVSSTAIDLIFRTVGIGPDDPSKASMTALFNVEEYINVEPD